MPFHFCPQCGTKLQPDFKFCPSCGDRLPRPDDDPAPVAMPASLGFSPPAKKETSAPKTTLAFSTKHGLTEGQTCATLIQATARAPLRQTRKSHRLVKVNIPAIIPPMVPSSSPVKEDQVKDSRDGLSPPSPKRYTVLALDPVTEEMLEGTSSPVKKSPRPARGRAKPSSPAAKKAHAELSEINKNVGESAVVSSSSQTSKSPFKGKNKAKKVKYMCTVAPLEEGEELTDTTGKKWTLLKLLSQSTTELIYEVSPSSSKESNHILKLGAKDGKIFNEQNFLQRAAKPPLVEKWIKQNKMDFLGIPSCLGFGLHADSYRFLIFSSMGQSLQSIMEEEKSFLSETTVLQLACRILDVLHYIHTNEYVHADINAENIYIQQGDKSQVFLVGYCHAFRFCPSGNHVEYREDSKTPHEGATEFISLDAHRGAAPSRRSDLQSLAYCMLRWHTGTLPWSGLARPEKVAAEKQRYMEDVPALLEHCFGKKKVSGAFKKYVSVVMALQYAEVPDYGILKEVLVQQPSSC